MAGCRRPTLSRPSLRSACIPAMLILAGCYRAAPLDEAALLREIRDRPVDLPAGPSAPGTPIGALSEDDAVAMALKYNPDLRVQRAQVDVARAEVREARRLDNPEVRVANGWEEDPSFGEDRFTLDLRWSPEPLPSHLATIAAAEAVVPAVQAEAALEAWEVRQAVRLAWTRAAFESLLAVVEEERAGLLRSLRERFAASPGADPVQHLDAQVEASRAEDRVRRQRDEAAGAIRDLARLLGLGSSEGLVVAIPTDPAGCPAPASGGTDLVAAAAQHHPRIRLARAAYAAAEAQLKVEVARQIPWVRWIQVGWGYQPDTKNGVPDNRNQLRLGMSLDLPILDWNQGGIAAGKARRTRQAERFRDALTTVVGDVNEALRRQSAARDRLDRLVREAMPLADRSTALTTEAVRAGRLTEVDLLKVRLDALDVREALLEAARDCREAAVEVEASRGVPAGDAPGSPGP